MGTIDKILHLTLCVAVLSQSLSVAAADYDRYNVTMHILHTNDFHGRIEEIDKYGGVCSEENSKLGECFGGVSRIKTMIDKLKIKYHTLIFDAGNQYQGSLWTYHYGGEVLAKFINHLGYDYIALGVNEFDHGLDKLVPFVMNVRRTILSSNFDDNKTPGPWAMVRKSGPNLVDWDPIGVIGYTTALTSNISKPETIKFTDVVAAVQAEVDSLILEENITRIVAYGNQGFSDDVKMARALRGVDIIIGGHSNTFLYT
ncbi:hypothetical protein EGW08_003976, partial [Elysia chlorotica]